MSQRSDVASRPFVDVGAWPTLFRGAKDCKTHIQLKSLRTQAE